MTTEELNGKNADIESPKTRKTALAFLDKRAKDNS
jgi:hypothetical protein